MPKIKVSTVIFKKLWYSSTVMSIFIHEKIKNYDRNLKVMSYDCK